MSRNAEGPSPLVNVPPHGLGWPTPIFSLTSCQPEAGEDAHRSREKDESAYFDRETQGVLDIERNETAEDDDRGRDQRELKDSTSDARVAPNFEPA